MPSRELKQRAVWKASTSVVGGLTLRCAKCKYGRFKIRCLNRQVSARCHCGATLTQGELVEIMNDGPSQEEKINAKARKIKWEANALHHDDPDEIE